MTLQARPTTYNGIAMRSRLEARFAALWDHLGWVWEYEPRAYASPAGQYLPDFLIVDDRCAGGCRHGPTFIEVKGTVALDAVAGIQKRMEIILESEPGATLILVVEDGSAFYWRTVPDRRFIRWEEAWSGPRHLPAKWSRALTP